MRSGVCLSGVQAEQTFSCVAFLMSRWHLLPKRLLQCQGTALPQVLQGMELVVAQAIDPLLEKVGGGWRRLVKVGCEGAW